MNNEVREILVNLIAEHGPSLVEDPRQVETLLKERCGGGRELFVLVTTLKYRVADELLASDDIPVEITIPRLVEKIVDDTATSKEATQWAVETWAEALGLISEDEINRAEHDTTHEPAVMSPIDETELSEIPVEATQFCYVPPGLFMMGSHEEKDEEPVQKIDIPYGYWLGRYPVTVEQWQAFVRESDDQSLDEKGLNDPLDYPVRHITWRDAVAYCHWLTEKWHQTGVLPQDWRVQLPSEAEWEKAARGGFKIPATRRIVRLKDLKNIAEIMNDVVLEDNPLPDRRFPWGDAIDPVQANYKETTIDDVTSVQQFSAGVGPYGCEDMSGNVWEWTRSHYEKYPYNPADGRENGGERERRALRGGAFYDKGAGCRGSVRLGISPDTDFRFFGFRIALVPSINTEPQ